jgi:hypothetical protein
MFISLADQSAEMIHVESVFLFLLRAGGISQEADLGILQWMAQPVGVAWR